MPINIFVVSSLAPVFVYNKTQSLDDNVARFLQESGIFDAPKAALNSHRFTFVGNLVGEILIDARDDPFLIGMCELSPPSQLKLQFKQYSDQEIKER